MQSKFTTGLVVLALLFSSLELSARTEHKKSSQSTHSRKRHKNDHIHTIDQCKIDKACGILTLRESGEYKVKENIVGTIVIATDSVCLDLGCHTLDANGADSAIIIKGTPLNSAALSRSANPKPSLPKISNVIEFKKSMSIFNTVEDEILNQSDFVLPSFRPALKADVAISDRHSIKVFNGTIIGSRDAGILVDTCFDISLFDLSMLNNAQDAIRVTLSNAINVSNVAFLGNPAGERALLFDTCDNLTIKNVTATGYLSTTGAIIEFDGCNTVTMHDVAVTDNTKTAAADVEFFALATAFVGAQGCTNFNFTRVKVNNNIIDNYVPLSDPTSNWRTFEGIEFLFSYSCSLTDCETSFNEDVTGATVNFDTEDFLLCFLACENFTITGHKSNNNICDEKITYFIGTAALNSICMAFDGCQSNNNSAAELVTDLADYLIGFDIAPYFNAFATPKGITLRYCQANFNSVVHGGADRSSSNYGFVIGILIRGSYLMDHCLANNNSMGDAPPLTNVIGIVAETTNGIMSYTLADNNTGASESAGLSFLGGASHEVLNSSASFNGNYGISIGANILLPNARPTNDIAIVNSIITGNGTASGPAAGIFVVPANSTNLHIKGCEIYDTGSGLSTSAYGISAAAANNVLVENTTILGTAQASQLYVITTPAILPPIPAAYTTNSPRNTLPIQAPAEVTNPTNACSAITPIPGEIAIVLRDGACGSGTFVGNTNAGQAVATIIVTCCGTAITGYAGTATQTAVAISEEDGNALIQALADNPGTQVSIVNAFAPVGAGIHFDTITNGKVRGSEISNSRYNGIEVVGDNEGISLIETIVQNNGVNGIEFATDSTASCSLVQDCRAINNVEAGFVNGTDPFDTVYMGNEAQCNNPNFSNLQGKISLQTLSKGTGAFAYEPISVNNNAAFGARFTNVSVVS